jgi:hypothetical protein
MIRRAVSLLLCLQLVLTPGLLCRCAPACGDETHAVGQAPHVHLPRFPARPAPQATRCSHHEQEPEVQIIRGVDAETQDPCDGAAAVGNLEAAGGQARRSGILAGPSHALTVALLPVDRPFPRSKHATAAPTGPPGPGACPIFLRTLALLI